MKKTAWIFINIFGGIAVIGSYVLGFLTHPDASNILWGGVPSSIRPLYTFNMFFAAAGYLICFYFILRLNPDEIKVFGHFGFGIFSVLYLAILLPSALWMPLTLLAVERASQLLVWLVRVDLVLVGVGSLGVLLALLNIRPRYSGVLRILAILGGVVLSLQTAILDAIVWSSFFYI
jgi:hypothetical protein